MGIKLPDNAKILMAGLPFHGLWKDGAITLPNDETKAVAGGPLDGSCFLVKVPDQPAVSRTTEEAAADEAAGLEWRNYGLISGGKLGDIPLMADNVARIFYIDSTKKRWLLQFEKNSATSGQFFLKVSRFGHIDGTTQSWSAGFAIALPAELWNAIGVMNWLTSHAQNSTGSDAVIGTTTAMVRLYISGDVDLGETGFGLTMTNDLLEYYGRPCVLITSHVWTTGVITETQTYLYIQYYTSSGLPTGVTHERITTWEDGEVVSDNPPEEVSGCYWDADIAVYGFSSDKVRSTQVVWHGIKYVIAAYHGDVFTPTTLEWTETSLEEKTYVYDGNPYHFTEWIHDLDTNSLKSLIGEAVINEQSAVIGESNTESIEYQGIIYFPSGASWFDSYDDTTYSGPSSWESSEPRVPWEDYTDGGVDYKRSKYLATLIEPARSGWKNPVAVLITQRRTAGAGPETDVYTTHSIHAPSLASAATTTHIDSLHATWQPVTDQLAVDTEKVCWF